MGDPSLRGSGTSKQKSTIKIEEEGFPSGKNQKKMIKMKDEVTPKVRR